MELGMDWSALPEGCIATILSLTSPEEACRLSLLCKTFLAAATSDAVWERFLPADYADIVSRSSSSSSSSPLHGVCSKRELYFRLCDSPVLIDGNKKSVSLERRSGKKCYMLSARDLLITWGDTPKYWTWFSTPESRFQEVAKLVLVWWFAIDGKISTRILSPKTNYAAYFVFKWSDEDHSCYGFNARPLQLSIGPSCGEKKLQHIDFDPMLYLGISAPNYRWRRFGGGRLEGQNSLVRPGRQTRADGWNEIEIGEFYNLGDEAEDLTMSLLDKSSIPKGGLVVCGIEIRPKEE